jgi:hypothetical protein
MFGLVITRMGSYGEKNAATKERQALTWKRIYGCDNVGYHWYLLYDLF